MLLVGTSGGSVLSYTADHSQLRLCVDTEHPDIACLAATSASEDRLLSCAWGSGDLLAHDLHTGRPVARGVGHTRFCRSLVGDPAQAALVLSASYDATVRLWDLRAAAAGRVDDGPFGGTGAGLGSMAEVVALRGHKGSATAAHFLPGDSHYVLSTCNRTTARPHTMWN
jgi:WD40 repeat protein